MKATVWVDKVERVYEYYGPLRTEVHIRGWLPGCVSLDTISPAEFEIDIPDRVKTTEEKLAEWAKTYPEAAAALTALKAK